MPMQPGARPLSTCKGLAVHEGVVLRCLLVKHKGGGRHHKHLHASQADTPVKCAPPLVLITKLVQTWVPLTEAAPQAAQAENGLMLPRRM